MRLSALALGVLLLVTACAKHDPTAPAPRASASSAAPAFAVTALARVEQPSWACRVLALSGTTTTTTEGASPLKVGDLVGDSWLTLQPAASVALRHTLTSRELRLIGPARVLPCRRGREQFLLAHGSISTSRTLGVRPGAEVLLATPAGTVHYGDADLTLAYDQHGLHVRVISGEAWIEPVDPPKKPLSGPILAGQEALVAPPRETPAELVAACQAAAQTAFASAKHLLEVALPTPPDSLGARAAKQVRDRGSARRACAVAAAAAESRPDPAERKSLWASIAHAEELWQSIPRPGSAEKP